ALISQCGASPLLGGRSGLVSFVRRTVAQITTTSLTGSPPRTRPPERTALMSDSIPSPAQTADQAMENRVLKKVTWRLNPFIIAMYFINYLDRTNISIA